jgi:hypothetical protein
MRWFRRTVVKPAVTVSVTGLPGLVRPPDRPHHPPKPPFEPLLAKPQDRSGGRPFRLGSGGLVKVVGESHYQPALKRGAGGRVEWASPIRVVAELVPEPSNPYDRNAVRVDVDGQRVGYLQAAVAGEYQPALLGLAEEGRRGWCEGRILGGGKHYYGIHLALDQPDFVRPFNEPGDLAVLDAWSTVSVAGGRAIQGTLEQAAAYVGCSSAGSLWVELTQTTAASGKYAGGSLLMVCVGGLEVGSLSHAMSLKHMPPVAVAVGKGQRPGCLAYLERGETGWAMRVRLPDVTQGQVSKPQ